MKMYIGFSKPNKWKIGAEAIMAFTRAPYSHAYLRFESQTAGVPSNIYHAAHGMVHFRTEENFLKENVKVAEYSIEVTPEERVKFLIHCMNIAGEGYGTCELVKILATDILDSIGIHLKTYNGTGYICSELVGTILDDLWDIKFPVELWLLKPRHIEQALISGAGLPPIQRVQ